MHLQGGIQVILLAKNKKHTRWNNCIFRCCHFDYKVYRQLIYWEKKQKNIRHAVLTYLLFLCVGQLKEFQQKSSPASTVGEKGSCTGGAGAKKKRKVKGQIQSDAPLTDRNSPDNVSPSLLGVFFGSFEIGRAHV